MSVERFVLTRIGNDEYDMVEHRNGGWIESSDYDSLRTLARELARALEDARLYIPSFALFRVTEGTEKALASARAAGLLEDEK